MKAWLIFSLLGVGCNTGTDSKEDIVDGDGDGYNLLEDCDDSNSIINPGATETCDGFDNDCDDLIDDADSEVDFTNGIILYADLDGDGFAGSDNTQAFCTPTDGWYLLPSDCDDSDAEIHPEIQESCDGIDNNCNGLIDDSDANVSGAQDFFIDVDGDGFGHSDFIQSACVQPNRYVDNQLDCDDGDPMINPDAQEICDDLDNDCDSTVDGEDPSVDLSTGVFWYLDFDSDGFGDPLNVSQTCSRPMGYVADNTDCNDLESSISPQAEEICDSGVDNNCNTLSDDLDPSLDLSSATQWYLDSDGDQDGDLNQSSLNCEAPSEYVPSNTDCDDSDALLEGLDGDGDGFSSCDGDCDDGEASVLACDVCVDSIINSDLGMAVSNGLSTTAGDDFTLSCGAVGSDLVFEWTAPATGLYHFESQANYESAIAVFEGCYGNELECAYDVSGSVLDFVATEGGVYSIVIDAAVDGVVGNATLNITTTEELVCGDGFDEDNDGLTDCADEIPCWYDEACSSPTCPNYYLIDPQTFTVPEGNGVLTGQLDDAIDNNQGSCFTYSGGPDYSYDYEAPASGCAQISVVSDEVDVSMMVTEGCAGSELACNDDAPYIANLYGSLHGTYSEVDFVLGELYLIAIDAPLGASAGEYTLNIIINDTINCDGSPLN